MSEQNVWVVKVDDGWIFDDVIFGIFTSRKEALDAVKQVNYGYEVYVSRLPLNKAGLQFGEIDEILRERLPDD